MTGPIRLLLWTSIPTHHQSSFFAALRARGIDLVVHYFQRVDESRLSMGWAAPDELPPGERYTAESLRALESCPDWQTRIHIVPGASRPFLLRLAWHLSSQRVPWLHWSEHSWPRRRSHLRLAVRRFYAHLIRHHALGALAIGDLARREFMQWGVAESRVRFLPYAVPRVALPPAVDAAVDAPLENPRFLFLGQLCPRKGIDHLLHAMHDVLASHPEARLELAGRDEPGEVYERLAEHLEIRDAVAFSGVIAAAHIGSVLQRCEVLVLPSRHDGWGVVLNEAASAGKALIASDTCGAAHHLIDPHVNGYRFAADDRAGLVSSMLAYCRNPNLARRHGAESLRIFQEFTPERNALRLEQALQSLLDTASPRQRTSWRTA